LPKVSIILPTYNRADTILRALQSVKAQTLQDWELIVVDDGSTDNTESLVSGFDSRMILIRQENKGFTEARNAGIRASCGEYIAFLDSDDEFLPHHLELCVAFLDAFPDEAFVATELLENLGRGRFVRHYRLETSESYPRMAASIGSHMLDFKPGDNDNYLRVYETREVIGDWGRQILERTGGLDDAFLYRGMIFDYLRWGFLITITATVIRRTALEKIGLPETRWATGSDYHFMATLCRNFRTNFVSTPTFIKHELTTEGKSLTLGHVVTGETALTFARDMSRVWEELFWNSRKHDVELGALRAHRLFSLAETAIEFGKREEALECLREARQSRPRFWKAIGLEVFAKCLNEQTSRTAWKGLNKTGYALGQLFRGELSPAMFLRKAWTKIRND
jgi:glycosyltransferase involved in cell wall biosynthesis